MNMNDPTYYRAIWADVMARAIRDTEAGTDVEREATLDWIFNGNRQAINSFEAVCTWCGFAPDGARQRLLQRDQFRSCFDQWAGTDRTRDERTAA